MHGVNVEATDQVTSLTACDVKIPSFSCAVMACMHFQPCMQVFVTCMHGKGDAIQHTSAGI